MVQESLIKKEEDKDNDAQPSPSTDVDTPPDVGSNSAADECALPKPRGLNCTAEHNCIDGTTRS